MPDGSAIKTTKFILDGREVEAYGDESIWQVAQRLGTEIPHLCYTPEPGYRADGNCRACMVEVEGERILSASCIRKPNDGMVVASNSARAENARAMVFELLVSDQPTRATSHDPDSKFWNWADKVGVADSRLPKGHKPGPDISHPAMAVNLDACINCTLCVRACREVQSNDVIGMAYRNSQAKVIFDFDDAMAESTCVACGECVQACPTGALMEKSLLDQQADSRVVYADRTVDSVCPYCGVGCLTKVSVKDNKIVQIDGRDGPSNRGRLCVKGRFGYDYIDHPSRLTKPLIRRDDAPKRWDDQIDQMNPLTHFREATWEEALDKAASGLSLSEADPSGVRHQQRRSLHPPVPRLLRGGADGRRRLRQRDGALYRRRGIRLHYCDRRPPGAEPPGGRHLHQERGQAGKSGRRHGSPPPGAVPLRHPHAAVQTGPGRGVAQRHDPHDH
jgi:formate dehydrogenase major subunit